MSSCFRSKACKLCNVISWLLDSDRDKRASMSLLNMINENIKHISVEIIKSLFVSKIQSGPKSCTFPTHDIIENDRAKIKQISQKMFLRVTGNKD